MAKSRRWACYRSFIVCLRESMHERVASLCLCFALIAAAGCESFQDADAASEFAVTTPVAPPAARPDAAAEKRQASGEAATPKSTATARFVPPFPGRTELFEPPKRAQGTVRRDESGDTVELKGFIHVDEPQVVLSIDGVVSPIPEGGEKYGVQVISIQPPSVVLQRGRSRWTATLE